MKIKVLSAAAAVIIIAVIVIQSNVHMNKKEIKHFTAFFATEGESADTNNEIRKLIADQIGADCEELWLSGQTKENTLNNYIASGEYPDFISGESLLYDADALIPIDEYWDKYPNIKNYMTKEKWDLFRQGDGHIYWIPQFGVTNGKDIDLIHTGEAFWIQTRVLKWAGYPRINTVDAYFDLIERYVKANPLMENGNANIPFTILSDDWRYFCLENVPQFLDGYPNDGSCIVDPVKNQVIDYNMSATAKRYFQKLNEEYHKGILEPEAFTATYEDYLKKLSTGSVLGMVDQWWQFYYSIQPAYEQNGLKGQGYDYVPLPVTMEEGTANQWHTIRSAELDTSSGLSITRSCKDIEGAMQFVNDLLDPEIIKLRFWGVEDIDYKMDKSGRFYLTQEQENRRNKKDLNDNHYCPYSFFPRVEGMLADGINAFSQEYQPSEFEKNLPADVKECFQAYGVTNYVDMLGRNESPGEWYPMYSFSMALNSNSQLGQILHRMDDVKHAQLPQVIMSQDFAAAWELYSNEYQACQPKIYFQALQQELERRIQQK